MRLQIHHARLLSFDEGDAKVRTVYSRHTLREYIFRLGELYVLLANLFPYARGDSAFCPAPVAVKDFVTAFNNLNIGLEDVDQFMDFIKDKLAKHPGDWKVPD